MKAVPAALAMLLLTGQASAASVDGIWGVARGDAAVCLGVHVIVLRDGRYTKAMLDVGTTLGPRDMVVSTAGYAFDGARVVVSPSLSFAQPEPRQVYRWDAATGILLREEPAPTLTYRRCPDRPLRPLER